LLPVEEQGLGRDRHHGGADVPVSPGSGGGVRRGRTVLGPGDGL